MTLDFLGTGWSFPPSFRAGSVSMSGAEQDIHESLRILFSTLPGERVLAPKYGLDMHELIFEPTSTTLRTLLKDRVATALLVHEPRIQVLDLQIASPDPNDGTLAVHLEYVIRATNTRFNLVFPFYRGDASEVRETRGVD
jgi:phage baseplate assembly protein W